LKREFFAQKRILDEGARIENYDGKTMKTEGLESTTFDLTDEIFSGAKILSSGKIILKDGSEIGGSIVLRNEAGDLSFFGGEVDLSSSSEMEFKMGGQGVVKIEESFYSGPIDGSLPVSAKEGFVTMEGDDVLEKDSSGLILSKFSGTMKTNGHKVLGESTKYTTFLKGEKSRSYLVEKETAVYSEVDKCVSLLINCIEQFGENIRVVPKDNSFISIETFDNSLNELGIDPIVDGSSVVFTDRDQVRLEFTKDPLKVQGNFAKLSSDIKSSFTDSKGEIRKFYIEDGTITQCNGSCKDFTLNSIVGPRLNELRGISDPLKGGEYLKGIREKYGDQAQLFYLDFLVYEKNPLVYKSVISSSQELYERTGNRISPEFLYVGAVAEGLDSWMVEGIVEKKIGDIRREKFLF